MPYWEERAQWVEHGIAAGAIRNQAMLDMFDVSFVLAFPGGTGTADMIERAEKRRIQVKRC